jgi:hypothetical protein
MNSEKSAHVIKRFALKVGIFSLVALPQALILWESKSVITALSTLSACLCCVLAIVWHERPLASTLNYWDEAYVFAGIALAAQLL